MKQRKMHPHNLNDISFAHTWLHPPILKPTTQGLNSPLTIPPTDIPCSTTPSGPAEAHAYVYLHGRSFQLFPDANPELQDYFVPGSVIHALSRHEIINHLISEPSLREKIFETAPRLFVMCLFLFPDYEDVLQKLVNYGVDDKWLPLVVNDLKVPGEDWGFEERLVNTLIPNQARFMVSKRWLGPEGGGKGEGEEEEGEEERRIPVLTGQALPVWVMDGDAEARYRREWIGEEKRVKVHGDHDCLRKPNPQGLYALKLIKSISPFPSPASTTGATSLTHSAIHRSTTLLHSLRHVPHPHITRHYKTFFHNTTFYTILPAATCRLDRFIGNPSIGSITSPGRLREVMAQVAYLAGALAMIHDIPCKPGAGAGMELIGVAPKKKKKGFHLDIQPRNILVFERNGGHDLHFEWSGFECSCVVEVVETAETAGTPETTGTPESEKPRVVPSAKRLFTADMNRSDNELSQKYLEASNEMYFPPESEDMSKPVTQAYDMWSMGVLMLDVLVWGLYGGKNLGIDDVFGEMGTQRPPTPPNTDSVSPKVFKRTKVDAEPSNKKLYEPSCPSDSDVDTNTPSPCTPGSSDSNENAVEMRLKLTIPDRISHILEDLADAPRVGLWCHCIVSLLEPEPSKRVMTAGELSQLLQSDTELEGGVVARHVNGIRQPDEVKVLENWFNERRSRGRDRILE